MVAKNDITGDSIKSKSNSQAYRDNWEVIFGKKENKQPEEKSEKQEKDEEKK